jgi:hypothetical protein
MGEWAGVGWWNEDKKSIEKWMSNQSSGTKIKTNNRNYLKMSLEWSNSYRAVEIVFQIVLPFSSSRIFLRVRVVRMCPKKSKIIRRWGKFSRLSKFEQNGIALYISLSFDYSSCSYPSQVRRIVFGQKMWVT